MSEQTEARFLESAAAIRNPLRTLADCTTDASQENWERAAFSRSDALQQVFDSCERLQRALDDAERMLSQPPPKPPKRGR